jgi:hypothetical protein
LRAVVKLHVLAGIGHVENVFICQLHAWHAKNAIPQ